MAVTLGLEADLEFSIETPASAGRDSAHIRGTVRASGNQVEVRSDELLTLAGQPSRDEVRRLAAGLASYGLTVRVVGPDGVVVTLGQVKRSALSRLVTRSRHMRLGGPGQVLAAVLARRRSAPGAVELSAAGMPPATLWPILPTLHRRSKIITTTHDPRGGGHPRLYLTDASDPSAPGPLGVYALQPGSTRIGSATDMDLRLDNIDDFQAEILRTDDDEYVLIARSNRILSTVGGQQLPRQTLRTGSRIQLGPWRMSYVRDEFADHGRPYGGRIGGEFGHQRTQPRPGNRAGQGF